MSSGQKFFTPNNASGLIRYAWLPIPVFLALIAILWQADLKIVLEQPYLLPLLNFIFLTAVSIFVAYLAAISFSKNASVTVLMLGSGMLFFGLVSFIAAIAIQLGKINVGITVYNTGMFLSGFCQILAAAALVIKRRVNRHAILILSASYALVITITGLLTYTVVKGLTPVFFIQGVGPTPLRQAVLGTAIVLFALSGIIIGVLSRKHRWLFGWWYTLSLLMIATGLVGLLTISHVGSPLSWSGRVAQYIGGVYMLFAVFSAAKESGEWDAALQLALKESQERYRVLAEATFEGIVISENGLIVDANEQFCRMLGYHRGDLIGKRFADIIPQDDRKQVYQKSDSVQDKIKEHIIFKNDGTSIFVETHERLLLRANKQILYLAVRDITERKQAEQDLRIVNEQLQVQMDKMQMQSEELQAQAEELRAQADELWAANDKLQRAYGLIEGIARGTDDMIAAEDSNFRYIFFNDAYKREVRRLWGRKIELGTNMLEIMAPFPKDQQNAKDLWQRALNGESFSIIKEFGPPETRQVYDLRFNPVYNASGKQIGAAHIIRNITEQVQMQEELRKNIFEREKAEKELQNLNKFLEQKVAERTVLAENRSRQLQALAAELIEAEEKERRRIADILHDDLQQMLAAARMQLESACHSQPDEPILSNVKLLLEQSIAKSRRLSHELCPPVLQHSNLTAALRWIARYFNEHFGLSVELKTEKTPNLEGLQHKVFLFRAVQELLFNTVKHSGVKSARVALSALNGFLAVTVSDQGRGLNPDILESTSASPGLGLVSLRERASYIGGNLMIDSAPGKGSRFTLTIPLQITGINEPEDFDEAELRPEISVENVCPIGPEGIRVLFVDDHKVMRQGLIKLLGNQPDIKVAGQASNGREAIEQVRKLKPDVVVMDVSMPEMDGIEATRYIKAKWPNVRVIALSMVEDEHISRTMREAGAEAFVSKTASSAELHKAIVGIAIS